ncbi:hypothetical protein RB653_002830 [Dictyostelium firmibasis]|uniref:Uncharacterized protein n=1 Tax=Dictyostelium firmibasis TaxID=79012 RepID=A0AAN7YVY4_9MYCE
MPFLPISSYFYSQKKYKAIHKCIHAIAILFITTTGFIYAHCFHFPDDGIFEFKEIIGSDYTSAELLGYKSNKPITITINNSKGIKLSVPLVSPSNYPPFIFVFKFDNAC